MLNFIISLFRRKINLAEYPAHKTDYGTLNARQLGI